MKLYKASDGRNHAFTSLIVIVIWTGFEASIYKKSLNPLDFSILIGSQLEEYRSIYSDYTVLDRLEAGVHISGNVHRLKQMLDKLISNAFEHSKKGIAIQVSVLKNDSHVELSVVNEGIKLSEDKDGAVFTVTLPLIYTTLS